jgi:hypothetical protein
MNTSTAPQPQGRLGTLLSEYGPVAFVVYFGIFFVVLVTFAWAIGRGFGHVIDGWIGKLGQWFPWMSGSGAATGSTVGTWGAAYIATKLTQPLRIAATLALTPLVGGLLRRFGKSRDEPRPTEDVSGSPGAQSHDSAKD